MIRRAILSIGFTLLTVMSGYTFFGSSEWLIGLGLGMTLGILWVFDHKLGLFLGIVGLGLLILALFGIAENSPLPIKAMCNGMAFGFCIGMVVGAALFWRNVKPALVALAEKENELWLLKILTKK